MNILVTFAIETEFLPWRERRSFHVEPPAQGELAAPETYSAEMAGAQVRVVLTGAGPKPAAAAISQALRAGPVAADFCISSGLAGALRAEYRIGQVLAARQVRSGDIEATEAGDTLSSSEALISYATACGATSAGRFHTAGRVIGRAEEKKYLGETADAVEMESFVVLSEAHRRGIPAVAIRAISDLVEEDLPFDMTGVFTEQGRLSMPLVMAQMAKHPQAFSAVMKLRENAKTASTQLADFLDRYVAKLSEGDAGVQRKGASVKQS